ncbi:RagB/SusD family nutrient uptake outer membrane protein [Duncaniella muris]|jgi:hypothetical protein|uniref:RagB/SusD family nutrient uptake outer membrane protein n=1 Tax=Duncaniella muris TaxID=2094150 RepID=UPI00272C0176|nr:RagB/SusD family nutrient uptake outer membrane protein [Duncaniella muris]
MKSKITAILSGVAILMGTSACVDLDQAPMDQISDATFWRSEADATQAVNELYRCLPGAFSSQEDINTDNAVHGIKWAAGALSQGVYDPSNFGWTVYEPNGLDGYGLIRNANVILDHLKNMTEILSADAMNRVEGQTRFFRAYTYFNLIKQFGDVPYTDQPLTISELPDITRTDWREVYDHAMEDVNLAIEMLPATWDGANNYRVTKAAANMLKAEMALYFANPECQHYVAEGYQTAAAAAKAVIDSGLYGLFDEQNTGRYQEMFWEHVVETSNEPILINKSVAGQNSNYYIGFLAFPTLGWGGLNPCQSLVDCFETTDGAPIATSKIYNPRDPYRNRDPRLKAVIFEAGEVMYDKEIDPRPIGGDKNTTGYGNNRDATATGYYTKKWINPSIYPLTDGWDMGQSFCVYRFTETLLIYAEAMNEMSDRPQEALDAVNRVRARVGMPALQKTDPSLPTYVATQDDLRQRIRNEWRIEFAFEGDHRQWDVRRWNIAMDVFNQPRLGINWTEIHEPGINPYDGSDIYYELYTGDHIVVSPTLTYQPHNYVYPVPQDEIDLNKNLKQNPGY